jgi:hypothetical protein
MLKPVTKKQKKTLEEAISNLAIAAHELNECIAVLWYERVTNLNKAGQHDVRPAMQSIRQDVTDLCRKNYYSAAQVAVMMAALDAFTPQKTPSQVRSIPINGRGGAA